MDFDTFKRRIRETLPEGTVLRNPGGGLTTIRSHGPEKLSYIRGQSRIYVGYRDLYEAYRHFRGRSASSKDLKAFLPSVFDSQARPAGHTSNCSMWFMILQRLELCGPIQGRGVPGEPFYVDVAAEAPPEPMVAQG